MEIEHLESENSEFENLEFENLEFENSEFENFEFENFRTEKIINLKTMKEIWMIISYIEQSLLGLYMISSVKYKQIE